MTGPADRVESLFRGGIAQLGERLHGMQEVIGSIPFTSTTDRFSGLTLSSRGLGHHPFTVATGVRIPVGSPSFVALGSSTSWCESGSHSHVEW